MLYVLRNIGRLMEQPAWLQKEVFNRILKGCEIAGFNEEKRKIYEQEMNDEKRRNSELKTAARRGREEGRAETVKKMLAAGISVEMIANALGMSVEEIGSL